MTTVNDRAVLDSIFNPYLPLGEHNLPWTTDSSTDSATTCADSELRDPAAVQLELDAVQAAEIGNLEDAIRILTEYVRLYPTSASGYNNRAQAYRLNGDLQEAENDLNTAINLCQDCGPVGKQAFAQRAIVRELKGDKEGAKSDFSAAAALGNTFAKQHHQSSEKSEKNDC
ncbi:tetratricopeptide repeat protein 36-like [Paramacrobiotus metropolitanus]|uniref:tetratricopeptide repeat protein 36-like n=1 Tax=Paramacrobiotus metropolitanus TaxID=2943436 RepID=UPI0024460B80|nr:tetratricopeptide repeat protein 36-like [Paramacrobiotus metropolitanus]